VYRYVRPSDKRIMWIEDHGEVERDASGRARKVRGIAIDVTEKVLLEQELTRQAKALAEAGRRKSEFIATLAHELRTPLSALRASSAVLEHASSTPASTATALKVLRRQMAAMQGLVDDLMDVSRIEQGKLGLHTNTVDMAQVVEAAIEDTIPAIEAREQQLSVAFPERPLWVRVDELRMCQAVGNVLANASKFTHRRGQLSVLTEESDGTARITVRDDGIGIAPEKIDRLFDIFMQGDTEHSSQGLGLGLALVKSLVELHGGTVAASSPGLGKGSSFTIRLPLASQLERHAETGPEALSLPPTAVAMPLPCEPLPRAQCPDSR
jgi:signal transduction histidine kinase